MARSNRHRQRGAGALLGLMAAMLPAVADSEPPDPAVALRNAAWRTIFARPTAPLPPTAEERSRIELGYALFRDPRLSGTGKASCATCHVPERAFTDGRTKGVGPAGQQLARNVPGLYDLASATSFFWDGRASDLKAQAREPIVALDEMAGDLRVIERRLGEDPDMVARFAAAFPNAERGVTEDAVLEALAAYGRSLPSPETRFDRWVDGDDEALSKIERDGFAIFVGKGGCVACHGGWRFTDDSFHDIGLPGADPGRGAVPGGTAGLPAFRTPSLREAAHTAPYMHDGQLATLDDVVRHYAGDAIRRPSLSAALVPDLKLTASERAALVAFLRTLSSE